jgi:hypothetical protein
MLTSAVVIIVYGAVEAVIIATIGARNIRLIIIVTSDILGCPSP